MADPIVEAYARLSMHEFALEIMMAAWLARLPEEDADQFLSDFCALSRQGWPDALDPASSLVADVAQQSAKMADHFARKVSKRAAKMRTNQ